MAIDCWKDGKQTDVLYNTYIGNIIFMLTDYNYIYIILYMCAGIPKFGLAIVKDGFVLVNVVPITLATRSVLCRMLTAGVATLTRSGSVESVCYIVIIIY